MTARDEDLRMLAEVLAHADAHEDDDCQLVSDKARKAFQDMAARLKRLPSAELFDKQRKWLAGVYERVTGEPQYENLVSSGLVPRGREVETPAVLRHLPKRPPMARSE